MQRDKQQLWIIDKRYDKCKLFFWSLQIYWKTREIYHEREKVVQAEKTRMSFLFPILAFFEDISLAYDFKG